ncbi:unnamed protein product [Closterium sp. Yama58-4]|nr:unnamed protein product [Closterium sp. Yama58-4]
MRKGARGGAHGGVRGGARGGALRRDGRGAVASCRCKHCCHHRAPSLQTDCSEAFFMLLLSHAFPASITSTRVFQGASKGGDGAAMLAALPSAEPWREPPPMLPAMHLDCT